MTRWVKRGFSVLAMAVSLFGVGVDAWASDNPPFSFKGREETLVARDIGDGGSIYMPVWCGNDAILFRSRDVTWLLDSASNKKTRISSDPEAWPLNCTPDGRLAFYAHYVFIPNPAYEEYEGKDENPYSSVIPVMEIYGYEAETGLRQRFAVADTMGSSDDLASPDGKKISLKPGRYSVKAEAGSWPDPIWFSDKAWDTAEHVWFKDSSGMAAVLWGNGDIGVEFFGKDGWAGAFEAWADGASIGQLKVDRENRIYFTVGGDAPGASDDVFQPGGGSVLKRCGIESRNLVCEKILAHDELGLYEILPNGDILFEVLFEGCIRGFTPGATEAECAIESRYGDDSYYHASLIGISPDGRRLAFTRVKKIQKLKGETGDYFPYRYDLFLIELTAD